MAMMTTSSELRLSCGSSPHTSRFSAGDFSSPVKGSNGGFSVKFMNRKSYSCNINFCATKGECSLYALQTIQKRPKTQVPIRASASENGATPEDQSLVICFGEMLIDFVPTVAGLSLADAPAFKKAPGGAPANVAVGIARLGGKSAFIGKVGDDEFGYMLADILKKNNVHDGGILFDKGARTALAFVTLRSDGEREFMFFRNPSADMLLQESELNVDLIKKSKIFHYGSISLITDPCKSAHLAAMKIAKGAGALLSYDPNLRLPLWSSAEAAREGMLSIWDEADIIKISEEEIEFLTQGGDPYSHESAMKLMHPNLKVLLVTEGQAGCRYYTKEFHGRVPGVKVETIDTTGAGDAFVAGILSQLAKDLSLLKDEARLREALEFANACGAITTTEKGVLAIALSQSMAGPQRSSMNVCHDSHDAMHDEVKKKKKSMAGSETSSMSICNDFDDDMFDEPKKKKKHKEEKEKKDYRPSVNDQVTESLKPLVPDSEKKVKEKKRKKEKCNEEVGSVP